MRKNNFLSASYPAIVMKNLQWKKIIPGKEYNEPILMIDISHRNYARTGYGNKYMSTATHYIPISDLENILEYET